MEIAGGASSAAAGHDLMQVYSIGLSAHFTVELKDACSVSSCCDYAGERASMSELGCSPRLLVIIDAALLDGMGFDALIALRRRSPSTRIATVGDPLPPRTLAYAFRLGLKATLSGQESLSEIVRCLQVLGRDGVWIPRDQVVAAMTEVMPVENPRTEQTWIRLPTLTEREGDVLAELLEGKPNKAIATDLGISEQTVKLHLNRVYGKLGVGRRGELMKALADMRGRLPVRRMRMV